MSPDVWFGEREKTAVSSIGFCLPLSENGSRLAGITSCGDVRLITAEEGSFRIVAPPLEKARSPVENAKTMLEALSGCKIIPGEPRGLYLLFERTNPFSIADFCRAVNSLRVPLKTVTLENGHPPLCPGTFVFLPFLGTQLEDYVGFLSSLPLKKEIIS
jgi:hypothetical protein